MKLLIFVSTVLTLSSSLSYAVSFDCKKSSNFVEKTICNDASLGALDDALSTNYRYVSAANIGESGRKNLKANQRAWLSTRSKCVENACLVASYKKRIDEICDFTVLSGAVPLCKSSDEVEDELNVVSNTTTPATATQVAR